MYNIEQLKMFVYAVELGSFSASARHLGKVQSAVSQGISNLEIDFNVELFDRSTRKPSLTKEGEQLFKQVKAIVLQVEDLNASVSAIGTGEEGLIKIALDDSLLVPNLPRILSEFSQLFPATEVELIACTTTEVNPFVVEEKADLGLMFTNLAFDVGSEPCFIGHLPFVAVCHPSHKLAKTGVAKLSDLLPHRQLMLRGDKGKMMDQFPLIAGKVWWSNSFIVIKEMILGSDVGWAYLPKHLVEEELSKQRLVEVNVSFDHKTWSPPVDLVLSKTRSKGPALLWLEQALKGLLDET
ncbi:LysR family transcriptional regulator [Vibrio sp. Makdt]|uniref:LysR family transcriptional regulator n=1 Tax=Vibrio sp. Makdt TaxID=2998828 RepID=UPI0022CD3720|nr:LysR family transcriptional regulator [Vibrio sp. Makdt]MDA0153134.1 LysR family transcriptional regulator [Vibrio sp. Makdt]